MGLKHASTEERDARLDEAVTSYLRALSAGQALDRHEWLARDADLAEELAEFLADQQEVERLAGPLRQAVRAAATVVAQASAATLGQPEDFPEADSHAFGDYELLAKIGQGGMGVVYRARQKSPRRLVALKLLQGETQRFRNEAQTVAELDHPLIVPIYEVGQHKNQLYFSMKLIEGGSLAEHLPRYEKLTTDDATKKNAAAPLIDASRGQDVPAAVRLVAEVARAVHHAHQRGILHRDLKPSNILL
ncbi:MAG TPA: serine/threonine-protein kinase, partial [Gemmataceae bacterium]|nr:serine/threonine-protein kinase [Gemmataceae bacterium]